MKPLDLSSLLRLYGPVAILLGVVHFGLVLLVYRIVPDAYMDEIFHIGQTRRYCQGNYTWDPMITTPPGLYILALPVFCGRERYLNSLLFPILFLSFCRFRSLHCKDSIGMTSLITLFLPVLLHSSLLFYTDQLSLLLTVISFTLSPFPSSIIFLLSLFVRQTNIAWAFLYAGVHFFSSLSPSSPISSSISSIRYLIPFIFLALSFVYYIHWNDNKIVLGDASAHVPQLHLSQLLYLSLFSVLHSWPLYISILPSIVHYSFRFVSLLLIPIIAISLYSYTFVHPYLLADNRHIPFYFHRRLLYSPTIRICLSPIIFICISCISLLSSSLSRSTRLLFILSISITIIPAHLIEFRYFITPYVLWRLSVPIPKSSFTLTLLLELLSNIMVFSFVFLLFLYKPFEWSNEPGVLQRFMW